MVINKHLLCLCLCVCVCHCNCVLLVLLCLLGDLPRWCSNKDGYIMPWETFWVRGLGWSLMSSLLTSLQLTTCGQPHWWSAGGPVSSSTTCCCRCSRAGAADLQIARCHHVPPGVLACCYNPAVRHLLLLRLLQPCATSSSRGSRSQLHHLLLAGGAVPRGVCLALPEVLGAPPLWPIVTKNAANTVHGGR